MTETSPASAADVSAAEVSAADVSAAEMLPGSPYQIVYGCDDVCRDELAAKMTEKVGYAPDDFFQIGAAVASNAGPKVAGVIFMVKDEA